MAIELVGDSARGESFALARLLVDGDRIVEADAPGMERALAGLTLLEAAAVPGETLAADAVANAIGPALRASPDAARVAVAMSGGVDSAVAAPPSRQGCDWRDPPALARSGRSGRRARVLLAGRRDQGPRGVPRPRRAPRDAGSPPGVPGDGGRLVRARLRDRADAESVHALQRRLPLRRARRVRRARGSRDPVDGTLRADR